MITPIVSVYTDGGIVGKNPSIVGGTWAYRYVDAEGRIVRQQSGFITPKIVQLPVVTNNLTEMYAVVQALQDLPHNWSGMIYSDSQITLGRVFEDWRLKNIPDWLVQHMHKIREYIDFENTKCTLLDGHPTKKELLAGIGSRGHPVSIHNVWCDEECTRIAREVMSIRAQIEQAENALARLSHSF